MNENFSATINTSADINADWKRFARQQREVEIQALIQEERLKQEETRIFVENAFRDQKKQTIIEKLKGFLGKYFGLVSAEFEEEPTHYGEDK